MSRTITLRVADEVYEIFSEAAAADKRSISNMIETAALDSILEQQFADEFEMEEILSNEALVERLRKGSRDARARKGDYVD